MAADALREELAPAVEAPRGPRRRAEDKIVLDLPEGVVAGVADQQLGIVHPVVEAGVVEVGPVVVVSAVVDRRPVEELEEVPGVEPVLAPPHAHGEVERFAPRRDRRVDVAPGETDAVDLEPDLLELLPDELELLLVRRAVRPVVDGERSQWISRMPAGEVARVLDVCVVGIGLDVLIARVAGREVLIRDRRLVGEHRRRERGAVDRVVDRHAHVHVGERRPLGVHRHEADARHGIGEPLLEAAAGGVALRAVELPEVLPGPDPESVVRDP